MDYQAIKRSRLKVIQGQETINQVEHLSPAGAKIVTEGVIIPGRVVATDTSAAPVLVGVGSILRVEVTTDTYLAFGDETLAAVTVASSPAVKLKAGVTLVCATDDFVRTSAALTRLEVIEVL